MLQLDSRLRALRGVVTSDWASRAQTINLLFSHAVVLPATVLYHPTALRTATQRTATQCSA